MSKKIKISILILIAILASAIIIFYIASNTVKSCSNNILTIDKIKENYKTEKIKDIKQFIGNSGIQYALVSYEDKYKMNAFDIYNLKTGDRDILPINPYKVTLENINNENEIVFFANGEDYNTSHSTFPFKITCYRNAENVKSNMDFYCYYNKNLYLQIDKKVTLGSNKYSLLSDITLTFNGLDVLFGPLPGNEVNFFADQAYIPETKTQYIKEKNQFIITFSHTAFNKELLKNKVLKYDSNLYYKSIEMIQDDTNAALVINLTDTKTTYNIEVIHLKNELPFARVNFK